MSAPDTSLASSSALSEFSPPSGGSCDVLLIAGEHSGDEHAARWVQKALQCEPSLQVCALGGAHLKAAGAQLLHDLTESSVVGLVEVLKNYPYFKRIFEQTYNWIARHQPRAVCFVDYPGFNLRLAERLVNTGIARKGGGEVRLFYYISPQVWAWKKKRRFKMAELLDALAVIFPFELGVFADTRLPVTYVGHPFADPNYELPLRYDAQAPVLLLPGSRKQAVKRIFPAMLKAWSRFLIDNPTSRAVVIYPSDTIKTVLKELLSQHSNKLRTSLEMCTLTQGGPATPAAAALTSSGTMSLNVALAGIPGAIVYRAHPLTYILGRAIIDIPYLGIANLLLDRPAWREYIQGDANPEKLQSELSACLQGNTRRAQAQEYADTLFAMLSEEAQETPHDWLLERL